MTGRFASTHTSPGFTHELQTLTLTVHDLNGTALTKVVKLVDAGLTNLTYTGTATNQDDVLQIPKHSFQLSFGKLLQYLWTNVVLATLGYTSTGNMFATWVDCTSVGNWLYQQIGAPEKIAANPPKPLSRISRFVVNFFCPLQVLSKNDSVHPHPVRPLSEQEK